jgi:hypothetical protein
MLRIEEFNTAASAHHRRMVVAAGASVAGVFACLGLAGLLRLALDRFLTEHLGSMGAEAFLALFPVAAVPVFLTGMWLGYRRGRQDQRLLCPHCGILLVESRRLVVATRNCVQCGRRVLAEPL